MTKPKPAAESQQFEFFDVSRTNQPRCAGVCALRSLTDRFRHAPTYGKRQVSTPPRVAISLIAAANQTDRAPSRRRTSPRKAASPLLGAFEENCRSGTLIGALGACGVREPCDSTPINAHELAVAAFRQQRAHSAGCTCEVLLWDVWVGAGLCGYTPADTPAGPQLAETASSRS